MRSINRCKYCHMIFQHITILKNELNRAQSQKQIEASLWELKSYYWLISAYNGSSLQNCNCEYRSLFFTELIELETLFNSYNFDLVPNEMCCDICKILPCEIFSLLNVACTLSTNEQIQSMIEELQYHIFLSHIYNSIIGRCTNCEHDIEYMACLKFAYEFTVTKDIHQLQSSVYFWKLARNHDEMLALADKLLPSVQINSSKINIQNRKTIYLDFNVYQQYEDDPIVKSFFDDLSSKDEIDIICSKTHLDEVLRMGNHEYEQKRLESLYELTKGKIILIDDEGVPCFCKEDLNDSLQHTQKYQKINALFEEQMCIRTETRKYLFPYKENPKQDSAVGNSSLDEILDGKTNFLPSEDKLNNILQYVGCSDKKIMDYKEILKNNTINFMELCSAIYSIAQLLNIIGLHGDSIQNKNHPDAVYPIYGKKSYKTIRSGYYDNFHLSYATQCTYFVTKDKKLFKKASEIYKFIGAQTTAILLDDFIKFFSEA